MTDVDCLYALPARRCTVETRLPEKPTAEEKQDDEISLAEQAAAARKEMIAAFLMSVIPRREPKSRCSIWTPEMTAIWRRKTVKLWLVRVV